MVFNAGLYTDLPDNSILITANMQSETGFPSSRQLKSYVAFKSRLKLAARAVLSADDGLLVYSKHVPTTHGGCGCGGHCVGCAMHVVGLRPLQPAGRPACGATALFGAM